MIFLHIKKNVYLCKLNLNNLTMKKQINFFVIVAIIISLSASIISCSKEKKIIGLWQQRSNIATITKANGTTTEKNITNSAITLAFYDNDSVYVSYGASNPDLLGPNSRTGDSTIYSITESTLTIGGTEYQIERLTNKWLELSIDDSIDGLPANLHITYMKYR